MVRCPAMGYEVCHVLKNGPAHAKNPFHSGKWYGYEELNEGVLENEFYRVKVDLWKGCITSLVLKETGAELIDPLMPCGNMLVKDEDNGDFWEIGAPLRAGANRPIDRVIPMDPNKTNTELSIDKGGTFGVEEGEVCTTFIFSQKVAYGDFVTRISLYTALKRVEIQTELTSREKNVRYRIAFPTAIQNGTITHEIPFGSIERPEGEYPALNWADYSQSGLGLGLLNCGLPGNAVTDNKMLLSVLKCTSFVSYGEAGGFSMANSSEGGFEINVPHTYHYALVPHKGDWREAELPRQGAELNHPLVVRKAAVKKCVLPARFSFAEISHPQVMVSCLRRFGDALMLRVYEATGKPAAGVKTALCFSPASVRETDLLGEPMADFAAVTLGEKQFTFDLKPYEIRTFMIK